MDKIILYGPYSEIWEYYKGTENTILKQNPIFSVNGKLYHALHSSWEFDNERQQCVRKITQANLSDFLFLPYIFRDGPIEIKPGQMVLQAGPEYLKSLGAIFDEDKYPIAGEWFEVQDGFKVCCKYNEYIELLMRNIENYAIDKFDFEIEEANGNYVSDKANAAIKVFSESNIGDRMPKFLRKAMAKMIAGDKKGYGRMLAINSVDFCEPAEVLDRLVCIYYESKYCK